MRLSLLVRLLRTWRGNKLGVACFGFLLPLCDQRSISDSQSAEHTLVALNFRWWTERLRRIVGELDRRPSLHVRDLGDQADGIKIVAAAGIASAEIIGEQSAPTCTESNLTIRNPLALIEEVGRVKEIC